METGVQSGDQLQITLLIPLIPLFPFLIKINFFLDSKRKELINSLKLQLNGKTLARVVSPPQPFKPLSDPFHVCPLILGSTCSQVKSRQWCEDCSVYIFHGTDEFINDPKPKSKTSLKYLFNREQTWRRPCITVTISTYDDDSTWRLLSTSYEPWTVPSTTTSW